MDLPRYRYSAKDKPSSARGITSMFLTPFRRPGRSWRRWSRPAFLLLILLISLDFIFKVARTAPSTRISPSDISPGERERIFIASMHWNNEAIIRSHWSAAVLELVRYYGAENVYVSIEESGSWDNTKGALRELDADLDRLKVPRTIILSERTHGDDCERVATEDEEGWIRTGREREVELRRIPYLAGIRNKVMSRLSSLAEGKDGQPKRTFDKILWLNDVAFTTEDVTTLIATRNGDYAAACSLDFSSPPKYYDTFALRDISGAKAVMQTWPFFLARESRTAIIYNNPVPVKSCWNGIVAFQAAPFYKQPSLNFRGISDSLALHHLEGSECCLIHADNPLTASRGVWLNPNVRVSYNGEADKVVNPKTGSWPSRGEKFWGIWGNRVARLTGFPRRMAEQYVVRNRLQTWRNEAKAKYDKVVDEAGTYCLINEMQVLIWNGWAHV